MEFKIINKPSNNEVGGIKLLSLLVENDLISALLGRSDCQFIECFSSACLCSSENLINFIINVVMNAGVPTTSLESNVSGVVNFNGAIGFSNTAFIFEEFSISSGKRSEVSDSLESCNFFASGTLTWGSVVVLKNINKWLKIIKTTTKCTNRFCGVRAPEVKTAELLSSGRIIKGGDKLLPNKFKGNMEKERELNVTKCK